MAFSYFVGFQISIIIVIVIAVVLIGLLVLVSIVPKDFKDLGPILWFLALLFISLPITANIFLLIYPTLNLILQIHILNVSFFLEEFESGIISLRIISLWIGIVSMHSFLKSYRSIDYLNNKTYETLKELKGLSNRMDEKDFYYFISFQYTFYVIIIIFLWGFLIFQIKTLITMILNWVIFFIVDDSMIILKYSELLKGRILRFHKYRINFLNLCLYICLSIALFMDSNLIFAIISVVIIGIFFFFLLISQIERRK